MPRPEEIEEGLSRAVVGGIVVRWERLPNWLPPDAHAGLFHVLAADGRDHVYGFEEAQAFVDAVFAAERVFAGLPPAPVDRTSSGPVRRRRVYDGTTWREGGG